MANYAYLRVSTERQDVEHQKLGILEYCNRRRIAPLMFVEDTASGSFSWRARAIGRLLEQVQAGDVIVAAEVSRLARSTLQVLELLEIAAAKAVSVHIVKGHLVLDGSLQATITATILGLAAQIEREFIAARTKEALARRKAQGLPLGRPKGPAARVKLDSSKDLIVAYLHKGVSKRSIARILECSPSTLYAWLRRHRVAFRQA
jgi:DNA invertase Pin-like site-specific DNA recombinase